MKLLIRLYVCLLLAVSMACEEAGDFAPGGSRLFLSANPQQIGFNGTSELTVTGVDEDGRTLPDGTEISFRVDEAGAVTPNPVRMVNGTAVSTYHATFVAGEITITAISGGTEATATITVADELEENVFVSANPATFGPGGGTSIISAVVTDDSGNPISGLGVQFTTSEGTLQSQGDTIETNSNGVATDTLVTTAQATVTATTDNGFSGQTTILVGSRIVCHMSVSTTAPQVGQSVSFFDTSDDPGAQIERYHWDFGDGNSADGKNVQHSYTRSGTFSVVHSVVDAAGNTTFCDPFPLTVSEP